MCEKNPAVVYVDGMNDEAIREKLAKMVFYKAMPYASIELATLGNDAGIIGAAMLGR